MGRGGIPSFDELVLKIETYGINSWKWSYNGIRASSIVHMRGILNIYCILKVGVRVEFNNFEHMYGTIESININNFQQIELFVKAFAIRRVLSKKSSNNLILESND